MATTLTIVAIKARKAIRYGIIIFFVIVIGRLLLTFSINTYKRVVPKPPPPPSVGFGRMANIPFPNLNIELPEIEYTIGTITNELPNLPNQMPVFYIPLKTANLYSFDKMRATARAYGFSLEPRRETETLYVFVHPNVPAVFRADIVYETFSISFNLAADSSPLNQRAPDVASATQSVRQFLSAAKALPEDLNGPVTSEYLRVEGQNLVRALALSDAQLTKIGLFRSPVVLNEKLEYPSVTANPKDGNTWFIVSGQRESSKIIVAGEHRYFPIDKTKFETYPIKSAQEAFEDLKSGKGFIANLGLNTSGKVTIREVFIGYYDPDVPYSFYQPVIVFKGDGEFVAYVPAVTKDYYGLPQ